MFKVNEYFDGNVKSIAIDSPEGPVTIGAMKAGEYEFGTTSVEFMTVITGAMDVKQPGSDKWETYKPGETFRVEKDVKFQVKMATDTAYKCLYK
ncbi:MAG: pyrimidine/purine nucleoside phosphorylase [Bacteroidales bacterium]|nr:pyrimidine/purine nucleoside phosphorylase [Bacteroidales bacterium]